MTKAANIEKDLQKLTFEEQVINGIFIEFLLS